MEECKQRELARHMSRVAAILDSAASKKITDRRTFVQDLQVIYDKDEFIKSINTQSTDNIDSRTSWNEIMLTVHRTAVAEAERPLGRSARAVLMSQHGCANLMRNTVRLATGTSDKSLRTNDLMACIFQVLGRQIYKVYHETYINILVQHVLAHKMYWSEITAEQWHQLLRSSVQLYREDSDISKRVLLDTMRFAVQLGCQQSHLALDVKRILPFLEKIFQDIDTDEESLLKALYKLTYAICQQIGTESRIALCEFSEKSLPPIVDSRALPEKFDMLLPFVRFHHPGGVSLDHDAAYARDPTLWKGTLARIHSNVIGAIKTEDPAPSFWKLCSEVYRQIIQDPMIVMEGSSSRSDMGYEPSRKRRRLSANRKPVRKPIDLLMDNPKGPFIQILTTLLNKYPDSLAPSDYPEFLKTVTKFISSSVLNAPIMDGLCELCTVVIKVEKDHFHDAEQVENVRSCWGNICDTILRIVSANQNATLGHELLRLIIEHKDVLQMEEFFAVYLRTQMRWSASCIQSLLTFCTHVQIPHELPEPKGSALKPISTVRESLIHWALKIPTSKLSTEIPEIALANLLTALAMKFNYKREFREFVNNRDRTDAETITAVEALEGELFDDREKKALGDIERCHLALDFREDLFESPEESTRHAEKFSTVVVEKVFDVLILSLGKFLAKPITPENVGVIVTKLTVVAKSMSNFLELNVSLESPMTRLFAAFGETYDKILAQLMTMDNPADPYLVEALEALEIFYRTRYHCKVARMIVESTSIDFISHIFEFATDDENPENHEEDQRISVRDLTTKRITYKLNNVCRVRNSAHKILCHIACARIAEEISATQIRVQKNIMNIEIYRSTSNADLRRALVTLKIFGLSERSSTSEESLNLAKNFIRVLYDVRRKDEVAVRGILNILPHYVKSSRIFPGSVVSLLNILAEIYTSLGHGNYGPLVHAEFVKCLTKLIPLNPLLKLTVDRAEKTVIRILLSYVNSPFYAVRVEVARAHRAIFASGDLDVPGKLGFFEKVVDAISRLFVTEESTDESERADELATRRATAIHVLAAVIRSDEFLHSEALYTMIDLSIKRGVKIATIKKALKFVTKDETHQRRLLEANLHSVLSLWFGAKNSLQVFPWALADCHSQEEFSRRHIDVLLAVKLQRLEFREFEILCRNLDVSFARKIEQSFPCVISLLGAMIVRDSDSEEPAKAYASRMYERLRSNVGEFAEIAKFSCLLKEKLPDVVVDVVRRLHDRKHLYMLLDVDVHLPELNSPNFNAEVVDGCLRLLLNELGVENQTLVEHLVVRRPFDLQGITLRLLRDVHEAEGSKNQILVFHRYVYFYTTILQEISRPHFERMSLYVVRDLAHSLLSIIEEKTAIAEIACSYFKTFLRGVLPARVADIRQVLSFAVSRLVRIVQVGKARGALDVLRCLIIDYREIFSDDIAKLDEFPDDAVFAAVKRVYDDSKHSSKGFGLEYEIEHFLNASSRGSQRYSLQGLSHIRNELATRKCELNELYRKLESPQDFQQDYDSSTLHRLLHRLVEFARSKQPEISLAAAKCLGEIGPADLVTLIIHADDGYSKEDSGDVDELTFTVISELVDYLVNENLDLRKASADALCAVMSTSAGSKFKEKSIVEDFARILGSRHERLHAYVYPFVTRSTGKSQPIRIDEEKWKIYASPSNDLWRTSSREFYAPWLIEITCRCLECFVNFYTDALKPVCRINVEFCETLLPRLLYLATKTRESLVNDVCRCVNRFFGCLIEELQTAKATKPSATRNLRPSYECVRCMLHVVEFMRTQTIESATLDIDYLVVAKGAQYCSAYCTSALYAELWCERILRDEELLQRKRPGSWTSPIVSICEFDPQNGRLLQEIVREAYVKIGDPDSIDGCGISYLIYPAFKTQRDIHLRRWDKVTLAHDVEMSCGRNVTRDMLTALQQSGHQYLVKCLINKVNKKRHENVDDFMYEMAWRLADWSILEPNRATDSAITQNYSGFDYHAAHYRALESLRDDDLFCVTNSLHDARMCVTQSLRDMCLECSQSLYPILSRLQMLQEIEKFATTKPEAYDQLVSEWDQQDFTETHNFLYSEPILWQRLVMYQTRNRDDNAASTDLTVINGHLKIAEIAETQGHLPIAYRLLGTLAKKKNLPAAVVDQLSYQKALLDWKEKDQYMGRLVLRKLLRKDSLSMELRAKALRVYGNWMAEMTCESSPDIINKYYNGSIRASSEVRNLKTQTQAHADLARFADSQHQQIVEFTKTPQYESLVKCYEMRNCTPSDRDIKTENIDVKKALRLHQRQLAIDAAELEQINADMKSYLHMAVQNYLKILAASDNYDLFVYRVVSLWLDNKVDDELNKIIKAYLPRVPSHKFAPMLPQLATHMSNVAIPFTMNINIFIERCAMEHPHHTLPILLALRNAYKDDEYKPSTTGAQTHSKTRPEPRIAAANALIMKLMKTHVAPTIQEMDRLSAALISLAYYKIPEAEGCKLGSSHRIPRNQAITKVRNFGHVIVPTVTLVVRPGGNYDNTVGIRAYEETFENLGGVNGPKKIICIDSSGIRRRQLLKCQHDLRLDAIIQQVSSVVNSILKETAETKIRKLRIRTYKVVPLSRRSGVLEWCQNALPMSDILCDTGMKSGMHTKYYPNDWSVATCRSKLREVHKLSFAVQLKTFLECCKNLHPAFHHYFMEKYPSAGTWFEKKLNYVRSVATTSMFGYMLGLGGRNCKNILIDQNTAEVIHVDFGVAFDEGKVGQSPETVPFRLTRDMEAAMGICGVEGVMKNCCEQTVNVLRERRKTVITLLQVLLYDPLYKWSLVLVDNDDSPGPSSRTNRGSTDDQGATKVNKVAERAMLKTEQKLEGIEKGAPMSVAGQVDRLIEEARDPEKLCRMFYDWQPYL